MLPGVGNQIICIINTLPTGRTKIQFSTKVLLLTARWAHRVYCSGLRLQVITACKKKVHRCSVIVTKDVRTTFMVKYKQSKIVHQRLWKTPVAVSQVEHWWTISLSQWNNLKGYPHMAEPERSLEYQTSSLLGKELSHLRTMSKLWGCSLWKEADYAAHISRVLAPPPPSGFPAPGNPNERAVCPCEV